MKIMRVVTPKAATLMFAAALFLFAPAVRGEVVRFEITERSPFAEGESFGDVGPYERIAGRVYFAVDPDLPQNRGIVDLQLAPRNKDGRVEFAADVFLLAPVDLTKGNGALLYDVNNRGNKLALRFFNDAPGGNNPKLPGNGFLMRRGYTIVWSGWIGELLPGNARLRLAAPVARDSEKPITGRVRFELSPSKPAGRLDVGGESHGAYRPTPHGIETATLTWRLRPGDRRVPIPREQFKLHVSEVESDLPGQLPHVELEVPAGIRQGYLYELIYEAQDPLVHGVSFASVRDLIAALRHGEGTGNPLGGKSRAGGLRAGASAADGDKPLLEWAYGFGVSQSGRLLREFLYSGFNEDERGRQVFSGLMPHVSGGGLGSFNHRFAQPGAFVTQHERHDWPTDRFPFNYGEMKDPLTGRKEGVLSRAAASGTAPKVMHTQTATEYWSRSGSLVHTDPLGKQDAPLPENVRLYAFGGCQHVPSAFPPAAGMGQTPANPADYRPLLRALLTALDRWCRDGAEPPESVYPTIAAGTLVDWRQPASGFPGLPGVRYPDVIQQPAVLDFGPRWQEEGIADRQPPRTAGHRRTLVPRCGEDGNELGCLLPPEVAVPVATYTGWSLRSRESGAENELVGLSGSYLELPATEEQRRKTGDPRPSLEARYGTLENYKRKLMENCRKLVSGGCLLEEDVERIVEVHSGRAAPLLRREGKRKAESGEREGRRAENGD